MNGKFGDTDRQPQRSSKIEVGDLIWEIGVGGRQRLNLGDQRRSKLVNQRLEISGGFASSFSGIFWWFENEIDFYLVVFKTGWVFGLSFFIFWIMDYLF